MPQLRPIPIETGRSTRPVLSETHGRLVSELARAKGRAEPGQICAYNQNRDCFVAVQIVAGDFPLSGLKDWLSTLSPNSGTGVWMVPFRGIVASDVSAPLDLLYLDEDCKVLDAVEFFPTFRVSPTSPAASSVLALPSHSIFASQTQRGDRLILCPPEEMEWHIDQAAQLGSPYPGVAQEFARPSLTSPAPLPMPRPVVVRDEAKKPAGPMLVRDDPSASLPVASLTAAPVREAMSAVYAPPSIEVPASAPSPAAQPPPQDPVASAAGAPAQPKRGWISRLLNPEPGDPRRKSNRQAVKGLAAHFFTGGAPHPHEVRDISPTGIYVVTAERWYPGTVIRMTLTKQEGGEHPSERSITVHAQSVRWGNDGVGLEFLFESRKSGRAPGSSIDKEQLMAFIKKLT